MKAYKLLIDEDLFFAHVHDRATGARVGYAMNVFQGWEAYTDEGVALDFGERLTEPRLRAALGLPETQKVYVTRLRRDAVERVWREHVATRSDLLSSTGAE